MSSLHPKVLIFSPTYEGKEYAREAFAANVKKILAKYPNARHIFIDNSPTPEYYKFLSGLGHEVHRVRRGNNTRESLMRAQQYARKIAIDEGYDYLMSLESDIFPPEDCIQRLLRTGKDVITGLYLIGGTHPTQPRIPCVTVREFNKDVLAWGTRLLRHEELPQWRDQGVKRVAAGGMGCCLISRDVFTKIAFMYDPRFMGHSDIYFFNKLKTIGRDAYVDTNLYCEHQNSDWKKVEDR